ncbi:MAG: tetratricopeptide repeat protein [Bdellovibrio sp.]|jgi:TolA-binding protein
MKNRLVSCQNRLLVALGMTSLFLAGCPQLQTRSSLREDGRKTIQDTTTAMQRANAETVSRNSELEATLRELNGRVEVVENRVSQADQGQDRVRKNLEDQLAETNRKYFLLQEEVGKLEMQISALAEQVAANSRAAAAAAAGVLSAQQQDDKENERRAKNDKRTPFDIGEEHFNKKEWRKAILNYQKYRDTFPKGRKFPESTYKIGVCFQELGMKDEAKTFYDELVAKFPKSDEARRARIRSKKMK